MNQELSRVQTYGSRRNGRKGKEEDRSKSKPVRSRASRPVPELAHVAAAPEVAVTMENDTPASEYRTRAEMFPSRRIRKQVVFKFFEHSFCADYCSVTVVGHQGCTTHQ